jgi:hypothetical protein
VSETQEKNKALIRRFFEAQEKGDLDAVGRRTATSSEPQSSEKRSVPASFATSP